MTKVVERDRPKKFRKLRVAWKVVKWTTRAFIAYRAFRNYQRQTAKTAANKRRNRLR